jgi:endonuclease/exonuclease/phosphatase family metal-dependent hydrolase
MKLTVLTYNTLFAGRDGNEDRRAVAQIGLINELKPDVFLMQEAKGLEVNGNLGLFALETQIGMRGFLAIAPRTGQNVAIFIREPLQPVSFEADGANFHHALAHLKIALPGDDKVLTVLSTHLCPNGSSVRQREAAYLAVHAAPQRLTLLAGDFNSVSPHDPEPDGFDVLAAHHRARYLADNLQTADRSVLTHLETAGWIDMGYAFGSTVPTVPAENFTDTEFAVMRCDYVLASKALAAKARSYQVVRTPTTEMASDHYPVMATFEV